MVFSFFLPAKEKRHLKVPEGIPVTAAAPVPQQRRPPDEGAKGPCSPGPAPPGGGGGGKGERRGGVGGDGRAGPLRRALAVAPSPQRGRAGQGLEWGLGAAARPRAARRAGPPLSFVCDSPHPSRRPPFCELAAAGRAGGHFFSRVPASPSPTAAPTARPPGVPSLYPPAAEHRTPRLSAGRLRANPRRRCGPARSWPRCLAWVLKRDASALRLRSPPSASHFASPAAPRSTVPTHRSAARPHAHGATRLPSSSPAHTPPSLLPQARPAPPHAPHPHGVGKPGAEKNDSVSAARYILCHGAGPRPRVTAPGGPRASPRPAEGHAALR